MTDHANRPALLLSGGIGDYLHYLTRLRSWSETGHVDLSALTVFVESTVPAQVATLFARAFPGVQFAFIPAPLHWTKTNPLLVAERELDRINRPAYRLVAERGFTPITDWFLPFLCTHHASDPAPVARLVAARPIAGSYVVVSSREKGFLWWPQEELCREIEAIVPRGWRVVYLGTTNERQDYMRDFVCATDVAEALAISFHASLFIGTDTGTATIRELMGRRNIYCVNQFWIDELMVRYGYWSDESSRRSDSVLACSPRELLEATAASFADTTGRDLPRVQNGVVETLAPSH